MPPSVRPYIHPSTLACMYICLCLLCICQCVSRVNVIAPCLCVSVLGGFHLCLRLPFLPLFLSLSTETFVYDTQTLCRIISYAVERRTVGPVLNGFLPKASIAK